MKTILIYGSREFGMVMKDMVCEAGLHFSGFIDDFHTGKEILGPYDSVKLTHAASNHDIIVAVGYNNLKARWDIYRKIVGDGYFVPSFIHAHAYVRERTRIGSGTIIMAGATVHSGVTLGDLVVAWPNVSINHDSSIGSNTFISPGATVCGCSRIGERCFIGAGAVVVDHVTVADDSFIKAGAIFSHRKTQ